MVKNPPATAGDMGSTPGPSSKISHPARQLKRVLCNKRATEERGLHTTREEAPLSAARGKPCSSEDPAQPKINTYLNFLKKGEGSRNGKRQAKGP